jgi:hypothetical protein
MSDLLLLKFIKWKIRRSAKLLLVSKLIYQKPGRIVKGRFCNDYGAGYSLRKITNRSYGTSPHYIAMALLPIRRPKSGRMIGNKQGKTCLSQSTFHRNGW